MNKDSLNAVLFSSLCSLGLNVKPYCILNSSYDALYLPDQNTIIPIDLVDDKGRRSPKNPVVQNNTAAKDGLNVFRIRSMDCTPVALTSFDYYIADFEINTILSLVNYLGAEFGASGPLKELPSESSSIELYEQALTRYDDYFKKLCCAYSDESGHVSLRIKEMFHNEHIGVWLNFKGTGFEIPYNGKKICSRTTSFGSAMDDIRAKGQQKSTPLLEEQWITTYNGLKQFCNDNGGISSVRRGDKLYGGWLTRQRTAHRNGKLSAEHERLLDELGINWEPNNANENAWNEQFNELLNYKKENGTLDVPQSVGSLGKWVAKQRQLKKKGKLPAEREQRLNDIDFIWESSNRANTKKDKTY